MDVVSAARRPLPSVPTGSVSAQSILNLARTHLGMDVALAWEFVSGQQVLRHVDAAPGAITPQVGDVLAPQASFCLRVLDGDLPGYLPSTRRDPATRHFPGTTELGVGAYVGVPIRDADGEVRGSLCCVSSSAREGLTDADLAVLRLLADLMWRTSVADRTAAAAGQRSTARVLAAVAGTGRSLVLQPIVDVRTGRAVAVEALARFTEPPLRPDLWFAEADSVALRAELELAAAASALAELAGLAPPPAVTVNLSPDVVLDPRLAALLAGVELRRVVLEVTEHARIADYDALHGVLAPWRAAGLRLAVDDAGAGYASFRHILALRPDLIKVDLSLIRGIDTDPVRQSLTTSLLSFAETFGAGVVAEGVETQGELDTLARLGVTLAQGFLFGQPERHPRLDGHVRPSPQALPEAEDGAAVLARAVAEGQDLESLTRPLLRYVLSLTGLESSYITLRHEDALEHRYIDNAGVLQLPERFTIPWSDSLCARAQQTGLTWTSDIARDLPGCLGAESAGIRTFLSVPVRDRSGRLLGTLCAASTAAVHVSRAAVRQIELCAHLLASRIDRR